MVLAQALADRHTIRLTRNGFRVRPKGKLSLAKIGGAEEALPETPAEVGIDLGLTHSAVRSDGRKITSPKFLRRAERKLRKAQRALSRKAKGSGNRKKAAARVARSHARVADARRDHHHRLSTTIIRENEAVYVEDLCVKGLARTRLAKSGHDAGWTRFVTMLEYRAARCVRDGPKPLAVRERTCVACGISHDRDVTAARIILAAGRAGRQNACGGTLGPSA